ncbi:competence/damage-inducible protein A [Aquipuribacter nitratireducens]|uniref:CinA-like protein n=1 Tax=Aquipuribacter nitratireducens TaxID=650104 RepID=A0ABW0GIK7_9MICO
MARAAVVVTGTEVLTGRVPDANGPWLAEQLRGLGADIGAVVTVGDRPGDLASALRFAASGHDLVITSGGLGPTADDLTVAVVADALGLGIGLDTALETRIRAVVDRIAAARGWTTPENELAAGTRKQALVPEGAAVLEPVGTAPGLVVADPRGGPPVVVLPGPPSELQAMWPTALDDPRVRAALGLDDGAEALHERTIRISGPPEAELAGLLREHEQRHGRLEAAGLEVTTCLRDGDLEVVTRFRPRASPAYDALEHAVLGRFADSVYSTDGATVDEVVAAGLRRHGWTVATAESCTAGLLAGRLADLPGSSEYLLGGVVTYSDAAKTTHLGVPADLIARRGAVSANVARAMAEGVRQRFGSTLAVAVTGIAGPGGARPGKPVGLVHVALAGPDGTGTHRLHLTGDRAHVRARTVTRCLHLLRAAVGGPGD